MRSKRSQHGHSPAGQKRREDRVNRRADIPATYEVGWLDQLDGRYNLAKQLRARFDEICADLGGRDGLSYMQRSLIERALWLEYWLASQERILAADGDFDVGRWVQAANSLQGIYTRLGIERREKPAPSLQEYLARRAQAAESDTSADGDAA